LGQPGGLDDPDLRIEHLALHDPFALGRRDRRGEDFPDHAHALGDVAERGKAVGVAARGAGIEARRIVEENEEIRPRRAGLESRHGDCSGAVLDPGLVRRLVRDRRVEQPDVAADPALDQPAGAHFHRPVEALAVEPVGVDIMEEVL